MGSVTHAFNCAIADVAADAAAGKILPSHWNAALTLTGIAQTDTINTFSLAQTFTVAPVFTDASGTRTALGLGTAAVKNTGTSGNTVPLLDGANAWSATQTFNAGAALPSAQIILWNGEVGFGRNSSTAMECNNGTLGTYRDLTLRDLNASGIVNIGLNGAVAPIINGYFGASLRGKITMGAGIGDDLQLAPGRSVGSVQIANGGNNNALIGGSAASIGVFAISAWPRGGSAGAASTISVTGGSGSTLTTGSAGGSASVAGGAAGGSGNNNGGDVLLDGGALTGTGTNGNVIVGNTLGFLVTKPKTVASLPAAAAYLQGARSFVTDANATTFLSTVAGGGANKVPVVCDGTNWVIG